MYFMLCLVDIGFRNRLQLLVCFLVKLSIDVGVYCGKLFGSDKI